MLQTVQIVLCVGHYAKVCSEKKKGASLFSTIKYGGGNILFSAASVAKETSTAL